MNSGLFLDILWFSCTDHLAGGASAAVEAGLSTPLFFLSSPSRMLILNLTVDDCSKSYPHILERVKKNRFVSNSHKPHLSHFGKLHSEWNAKAIYFTEHILLLSKFVFHSSYCDLIPPFFASTRSFSRDRRRERSLSRDRNHKTSRSFSRSRRYDAFSLPPL